MARRKRGDEFRFVVEGGGSFPFDMLRYDACYPVHESQARSLGSNFKSNTLVVLGSRSDNGPTEGRWRSQGWRVRHDIDPGDVIYGLGGPADG